MIIIVELLGKLELNSKLPFCLVYSYLEEMSEELGCTKRARVHSYLRYTYSAAYVLYARKGPLRLFVVFTRTR